MLTPHPTPLDPPLAINYRNHQKSLVYFSHLTPLISFLRKGLSQKEGGAWHNAPLDTLLVVTSVDVQLSTQNQVKRKKCPIRHNPMIRFIRNPQIRDLVAVSLILLHGPQGDRGPQFENFWSNVYLSICLKQLTDLLLYYLIWRKRAVGFYVGLHVSFSLV